MITHTDLQTLATDLLAPAKVEEARVRLAVSTIYYGLFHHLTAAASAIFDAGGPPGSALAAQVSRAFSHTLMRKVCDTYVRSTRQQKFPPPLDRLHPLPPDKRLIDVADLFIRLQEARETADYDLTATLGQAEAQALVEQAQIAHADLQDLEHQPETRIFLTALLLSDRWTRRA